MTDPRPTIAHDPAYLRLLAELAAEPNPRPDRTGVGTFAVFGRELRFDLTRGFPLLTTKRVAYRAAFLELLWMLSGSTSIRPLLEKGVSIWTDWPYLRFVHETGDKIGARTFERRILEDDDFARRWADLGPVYGAQWRAWPDGRGGAVDQVRRAVETLRTNPVSRRNIIEGWNVGELDRMAMPPCHKTYQLLVDERGLTLLCQQRSCDLFLGVPFNVANGALLCHLLAREADLPAAELIWYGADVHLYRNHLEQARTQLARKPRPSPRLAIAPDAPPIDDIAFEHIRIEGYDPDPAIKAEIAV